MPRRSTEQQILDLEAKIQSIKERAERKKVRANPAVKFMSMALRSIDKALNATDDKVLKTALDEARATVASCLALTGVKPKTARRVLGAKRRAGGDGALDGEALLTYIRNHPGSSSETITKQFSTDATTLRPVMRKLIDDGKVKTKGERRGMRYFVGV